jgi:hypothetical protein
VVHSGSCGWVRGRTKDGARRVEYLDVVCERDVGVERLHAWWIVFWVGVRAGSLQKISVDEVGEVWVANLVTEGMETVWIVGSC